MEILISNLLSESILDFGKFRQIFNKVEKGFPILF